MITFRSTAIAAIALAASAGLAIAQTHDSQATEQMAQAGALAAQAGPQSGMAMQDEDEDQDQGGMMGGGMMGRGMMGPGMMGGRGMMGMAGDGMMPMMRMMQGMMQMMQGMMQMMQGAERPFAFPGMMPGAFVEEHLAAMKAELGITDAQQPQWNAFADAMRARVKAMQEMRAQMMQRGPAASWPDRLTRHEQRLSARLDALKAMEAPTRALWDGLSDEQRRKANELMVGRMGMMGRM